MRNDRGLAVFLAVFAIAAILLNSYLDLTISNSYQRADAAAFIAQSLTRGDLFTTSFSSIKQLFTSGHEHYKIFSGISDWPPLQLILLLVSFLVFGMNKTSLMVAPLLMTLGALVYAYLLAKTAFPGKNSSKAGLTAVLLSAVSTFFLYESAAPLLENTILLFTLMCFYHFLKYLDKQDALQLYISAGSFALGLMAKEQMILAAVPMAAIFLMRIDLFKYFKNKKTWRAIGIAALIFSCIMLPYIFREIALSKVGLSQTLDRSVGRIQYMTGDSVQNAGLLFPEDLEFVSELPQAKKDLFNERYNLPSWKKAILFITSLFYNWAVLPLVLIGLLAKRNWKNGLRAFNDAEIMVLVFFITNAIFFSLLGLLPRYTLILFVPLMIFAARGAFTLKPKVAYAAITIILLLTAGQTALFLAKVAENRHQHSMQHNYEPAAKYILEHSQGDITVVTSRVYQMSFYTMKYDSDRRVFVEQVPQDKESLIRMLAGNFSRPRLIEENNLVDYETSRPPVKYVVVHEGLETGPIAGLSTFNFKEFMDSYNGAVLAATVHSQFPHSETWIYALR